MRPLNLDRRILTVVVLALVLTLMYPLHIMGAVPPASEKELAVANVSGLIHLVSIYICGHCKKNGTVEWCW